ncbi:Uromodulin [Nibea albiflora]|uniref:Uromodulin n=1 Tax=Nibea albiflora TaxID=240163 RepID=A0ACB7ELR5_NIBAL|nr:Uromodulin [Nibea albiflora]
MDEETHMVTFSFNNSKPCGAVVLAGNKRISYKNTIKTSNSTTSGLIFRHDAVDIDFSCFYSQPDLKAIALKVKGGQAVQQVLSGSWNYSLSLGMCADPACTQPLDLSGGVQTDQVIYLSMDTKGLDGNIITLVVESCFATNTNKGNNGLRYDLVKNGCGNPSDSSVKVVDNGKGGTVLAFQMFSFKGSNSGVFLNCKMKLCVKNDFKCQPVTEFRTDRPAVDLQTFKHPPGSPSVFL